MKSYQIAAGLSNYVNTNGNIYETPKFRCDEEFLTSYEKEQAKIKKDELASRTSWDSLIGYFTDRYERCKCFYLKVLPSYMDDKQRNFNTLK